MLQLKSLDDVASSNTWWLRARHHFAIGPYGNPDHKPVGNLIVLNDDEIAPHAGFGLHQHANVEIVSYIHDGTLTHRDDQGNAGTVRAGAEVSGAMLLAGTHTTHTFKRGDAGYLAPATGAVEVNAVPVQAREGLVIKNETAILIKAIQDSELLLIVTA